MRSLAAIGGVVGVFALSALAYGQPPPISVVTAPVVSRMLQDEVSFIATLEPDVATTVSAEVAGRVIRSETREGDRVVAQKTVLAWIDPTSRQISLREAQAAVDKATEKWQQLKRGYRPEEIAQRRAEMEEQRAVLARAEEDFKRAERLYADGLISRAESDRLRSDYLATKERYQRAQAAFKLAQAGPREEEIAQAEAELREAKARYDQIAYELERTTVLAPIDGFVVKKHVEVGGWVNPGQPVAELVDLDPVYATGPVGERKISFLRKGLGATVRVDALPGRTFQGSVSHIIPQADPQSRTFPVKVAVPNPNGLLKSGMLARVTVRAKEKRQGLLVPKDALVRRGADEVIFIIENGTAREYRVKAGQPVDGFVEVSHPRLKAGQEVAILGNESLSDGAKAIKTNTAKSAVPRSR